MGLSLALDPLFLPQTFSHSNRAFQVTYRDAATTVAFWKKTAADMIGRIGKFLPCLQQFHVADSPTETNSQI